MLKDEVVEDHVERPLALRGEIVNAGVRRDSTRVQVFAKQAGRFDRCAGVPLLMERQEHEARCATHLQHPLRPRQIGA